MISFKSWLIDSITDKLKKKIGSFVFLNLLWVNLRLILWVQFISNTSDCMLIFKCHHNGSFLIKALNTKTKAQFHQFLIKLQIFTIYVLTYMALAKTYKTGIWDYLAFNIVCQELFHKLALSIHWFFYYWKHTSDFLSYFAKIW